MLYICQDKNNEFPKNEIEGIRIGEEEEADLELRDPYEGYIEEIGGGIDRAYLIEQSSCLNSSILHIYPHVYKIHMPVHPRLITSIIKSMCNQIQELTGVSVSMHRYASYRVESLKSSVRKCTRWITVAAEQNTPHRMMSAAIILARMMSVGMASVCQFYKLPPNLPLWIQHLYETCPEPRFYPGTIYDQFITWDISVKLNIENPHPDILKHVGAGFIKAIREYNDEKTWLFHHVLYTMISLKHILNAANEIAWQTMPQGGNEETRDDNN